LVTRFALECIAGMIKQDGKTVDVTLDAYWRFNDELDRAASSKVYLDPRAHSYFTNEYGRSATNGAIDGRVLWNWLRNPAGSEPVGSTDVISPYFGHDIVVQ
jgi:4-hydroxyacetophenone monooxygenase